MLRNIFFTLKYLQIRRKPVPLHCVFHSIRFKVNKGWSKALLLFFCPHLRCCDLLPLTNPSNIKNMLRNIFFHPKYLQIRQKAVPLHRVFHSIRFKVNKGWSKALLLFFCPHLRCRDLLPLTNPSNLKNMLRNIFFHPKYLQIRQKPVPLHCVFHSIRFKVNKGWSKALLLFFCPYLSFACMRHKK